MFESVNKKTVVHPLFKVGLSLLKKMGSSLCLTLDGKRDELNVDFVLLIESFEA